MQNIRVEIPMKESKATKLFLDGWEHRLTEMIIPMETSFASQVKKSKEGVTGKSSMSHSLDHLFQLQSVWAHLGKLLIIALQEVNQSQKNCTMLPTLLVQPLAPQITTSNLLFLGSWACSRPYCSVMMCLPFHVSSKLTMRHPGQVAQTLLRLLQPQADPRAYSRLVRAVASALGVCNFTSIQILLQYSLTLK
jgi:hypothetical protein